MNKKKSTKSKNLHVIPIGNAWGVKGEGNAKFSFITNRKKEALTYAKVIAVNSKAELIVYSKDGRITEKNNYSKERAYLEKR